MDRPDRETAARQLGITLTAGQWEALERYVELLLRWNAKFNLISRQDVGRVWSRHVLDSLSILPIVLALPSVSTPRKALDVGSGAGFPGLPLAVADGSTEWLLIDRNARKVRFLELVASELGLANVSARVLDLDGSQAAAPDLLGWADVIVSRAVAPPAALVRRMGTLLAVGGSFVLMTGASGSAAEGALSPPTQDGGYLPGFTVSSVRQIPIPGLDQVHEVTIIRRSDGQRAE